MNDKLKEYIVFKGVLTFGVLSAAITTALLAMILPEGEKHALLLAFNFVVFLCSGIPFGYIVFKLREKKKR